MINNAFVASTAHETRTNFDDKDCWVRFSMKSFVPYDIGLEDCLKRKQ